MGQNWLQMLRFKDAAELLSVLHYYQESDVIWKDS